MANKTEEITCKSGKKDSNRMLMTLMQSLLIAIAAFTTNMFMFILAGQVLAEKTVSIEVELLLNIVLIVMAAVLIALPSFWIGFHIGKRGIVYAMLIGFVWPLLFQLHRVFLYWQFANEFSPGFGMDFSDYLELPVVLLYSALAGYLGAKIAQRMTRLKD